jgi:hypothetical protein
MAAWSLLPKPAEADKLSARVQESMVKLGPNTFSQIPLAPCLNFRSVGIKNLQKINLGLSASAGFL